MSSRTDIRAALVAAATGLPLTGANVFAARTRPLQQNELPAILVFSGGSECGESDADGDPVSTAYRLRADILVREVSGETVADQILDQLTQAVRNSAALHNGTVECRLVGTGEVDLDDSTEKPALRLPVLFEVTYL